MNVRTAALVSLCAASVALVPLDARHATPSPPDLQGYWTNGTATPLERPNAYKDRFSLTPGEAAEFERTALTRLINEIPESERFGADLNDTYLETSGFKMLDGRRTSLIVDPPDGRLPPQVPAAKTRADARPKYGYDDPETLDLAERCLVGADGGDEGASQLAAPIVPNVFGLNYYQIVQTPTHVVLHSEVMHETRIVRIDGEHRLGATVGEWLGDSVGRWDGDTLVVDTTNFNGKFHFRGSSTRMHVVERFTRVNRETIRYRATVEDPDTWTQPWTIEYPFKTIDHPLLEFACHEANYSLENSLRGHRAEERQKKP